MENVLDSSGRDDYSGVYIGKSSLSCALGFCVVLLFTSAKKEEEVEIRRLRRDQREMSVLRKFQRGVKTELLQHPFWECDKCRNTLALPALTTLGLK